MVTGRLLNFFLDTGADESAQNITFFKSQTPGQSRLQVLLDTVNYDMTVPLLVKIGVL